MATLVLGAVGAAVGGSFGGSLLGVSAAVVGRAAGAAVGRKIDQAVLGAGADAVEHGRVDRFRITGASEGAAIPRVIGRSRVGGQVIWATRFRENASSTSGSGKGAPKAPKQTNYSYSISFAMALCEGEIARVGRVWADGREIARGSLQMRVHTGSDDQQPDSLIEAVEGTDRAIAYRGTAYVVIEDMDLTPFGNRIPNLSFEVVRHVIVTGEVSGMAQAIRGVALVPGTGEFALSTTAVHYDLGAGERESINVNTSEGTADFGVAIRDLVEEMPNVRAASLVVSWFGDDLRCGSCTVRPRAEHADVRSKPIEWRVSGASRETAGTVRIVDGRPIYGGTPSDTSVVEAIRDLNSRGIDVTFYPFILMDQLAGNGRPDPHGAAEQQALPWRGRITTSRAAGMTGSPDGTAAAAVEVARFFGTTTPGDFSVAQAGADASDAVVVSGVGDEWSYRRFILHYAHLCAAAGGVEAFCIGSEMRGLTRIRGASRSYPAVEALRRLAREVEAILPNAKIGYAADWSEYHSHQHPASGDLSFHLDPLWADPAIDFVGIDNYMPLADWRDGTEHLDAKHGSTHSIPYLQGNVEGGEGFDWYYPDEGARAAQRRVAITDGRHGEPWVFRYKDIRSWWSRPHHDRVGGVRAAQPTDWKPMSKPIRFTEYGCAAIDRGANQPNKFIDEKSSESSLPYFSVGRRDDAMQMQYHRALLDYWGKAAANPRSSVYGGAMLDLGHSFAWAWDTRPWPYFPELIDHWSDGVNYAHGHWLNGRSGAQPLATVIRSLCARAGLTDVDVSGVRGVVHGYAIDLVQSPRADLQPLLMAHGIEASERGGRLVFVMRADAAVRRVAASSVVRFEGATIQSTRAPYAEITGRVIVRHLDAVGDFEVRSSDAVLPGIDSVPVSETELPVALMRAEGRALAERFLAEAGLAHDQLTLSLPPSRRDVSVGDLLRIDGEPDLWRVDRLEDAGIRRVEAVRTDLAVFEPNETMDITPKRRRPPAPLPVDVIFADLPLLRGDEIPHAPHVAVTAKPWPGSVAIHSGVEDNGYRLNAVIERPTLAGVSETVLAAAGHGRQDRGPALVVRLPSPARLGSATLLAFLAGANAMAIGSETSGAWEIFQFRTASPLGGGRWALSDRLRGQRGTDEEARTAWPMGSRIIVLDENLEQIDLPRSAVGLERHYRIGPASLPLDAPSYTHRTATAQARGLRPWAPVHLRQDARDGGRQFRWIRRSRLGTVPWDVTSVPLGETRERYRVVLRDATGAPVLDRVVTDTQFDLDAAAFRGLRSVPVTFSVAQISDDLGPGAEAYVALV